MNERVQPGYAYLKFGDVVDELDRLADRSHLHRGGPLVFLDEFLRYTGESNVILMSTHAGDDRRVVHGGATAAVLGMPVAATSIGRACAHVLLVGKIIRELVSFRPRRILCGRNGSALWAVAAYAWVTGARLVFSSHNRLESGGRSGADGFTGRLDRWAIRRAHAVICHGPYLRRQLADIGVPPEKLFDYEVMFGGIGEVGTDAIVVRSPSQPMVVVFLGRVEAGKGVFDLLEALEPGLRADRFRLWYVGAGPALRELQDRTVAAGLSERVVFHGGVSHRRVGELLGHAHVVVTPTRSSFPEGRCMALLEALYLGRPVVAPDAGPFPYAVTDGENGLLFRQDSVNDLRVKLDLLHDDTVLYEKLSAGARRSGATLAVPERTYMDALEFAFGSGPGMVA